MRLKNKELINSFRKSRKNITQQPPSIEKSQPKGSKPYSSPYAEFLKKYNNLEKGGIESIKTRDLVYYFREVANEEGFKYSISNIKKDMSIFKRLQETYSVQEICGMIEFLYRSPQNYLDKERLSPNVLASQWVNTIYADMKLWLEDEYSPRKGLNKKQREWSKEVSDNTDVKIGEW